MMQSSYAFMPIAWEVFRTNPPLRAGGGLARCPAS